MIPALSVILPFHGYASDLRDAIQSILHQSFKDWELILVDNNASQAAKKVAIQFEKNDSRIRLIQEHKQGIAYALNTGIKASKSALIARMDADDIAYPLRFEKQIQYLLENPSTDVVSCKCFVPVMLDGSNEGFRMYAEWQNSIITNTEHLNARFIESPLAHPSVIFRKNLIENYGQYNAGSLPEDYELWLRWMDKGINFYKIPDYLMEWKDSFQRLSRTHSNYSDEAFWNVKCYYLNKHLQETGIIKGRKIVICGTSPEIQKKSIQLQENGIKVYGHTDIRSRFTNKLNFVHHHTISNPDEFFIINLIRKRGVGQSIKDYYANSGFEIGKDIILAG